MQQQMPAVVRLADHLFEGLSTDGRPEIAVWLATSPRYRDFVEEYRDKIRKKLRGATDSEARRDVRAELLVARLLLGDRGFALAYESYGSGRRGPDFTVTYRGERGMNLEVTRLRGEADPSSLGRLILAKLRQLPPSAPNVLLVATGEPREGGGVASAEAVETAAHEIRRRADRKEEEFFSRQGFDGTRDFYERFLRLGAVIVWTEREAGAREAGGGEAEVGAVGSNASLWTNGSARIAAPPRTIRACLRCLSGLPRPSA